MSGTEFGRVLKLQVLQILLGTVWNRGFFRYEYGKKSDSGGADSGISKTKKILGIYVCKKVFGLGYTRIHHFFLISESYAGEKILKKEQNLKAKASRDTNLEIIPH